MQFVSGQKISLNQLIQQNLTFTLRVEVSAEFDVDISSFGLNVHDHLVSDDYMTFYNQPQTPNAEVKYQQQNNVHIFHFNLQRMDPFKSPSFVLCAAVSDEQKSLKEVRAIHIELINSNEQMVATYTLNPSHFSQEKAAMLVNIYFKTELWRMAAIGQGFNGGLDALVRHFGADVAEEPTSPVPNSSKLDLKKKVILDKIEDAAPHLLDLTKKSLISLEKSNLLNVKARVALVLDYSGSMNQQYKSGDVQRVLDRIMPLALNFDDDGCFECWAFAEKALRLADINLRNLTDYINTEQGGYKKWQAGARYNNEPVVLEQVLKYFTQQSPSEYPVYVVFISDGGISETGKIKKILQNASAQPIFWQFVGIGGRHYGVLEKLDHMDGRVVDNCNFFAMDHIQSMPESELYDSLLREFPMWLKDAKSKNILK